MKDEIKEIYLSNLEWAKTHDNIGVVRANAIFKKGISHEEFLKLFESNYFILCNKDYITNLQEENIKLKQWDCNKDSRNSRQRVELKKLMKENERLKKVSSLWGNFFIIHHPTL